MNRLMLGAAVIALTTGTMGSVQAQTSSSQPLQPASCTQLDVGEVANRVDKIQNAQRKAELELRIERAREAQSAGNISVCRQTLVEIEREIPGGQQTTKVTPAPAFLGGPSGQGSATARTSADPRQAPIQADNVVAALRENKQFSTLVGLIERAGLVETLSQSGPYTIFAPTNAAFDHLPQSVRDRLNSDEGRDQLRAILAQHVVQNQSIASNQIPSEIKAMGGDPIDVSMTNGRPRLHTGDPLPPAHSQTGTSSTASAPASTTPVESRTVADTPAQTAATPAPATPASGSMATPSTDLRDARVALENADTALRGDNQEMQAVQEQIGTAREALNRALAQAQAPNREPLERANAALGRAGTAAQANDRSATQLAVNDALLPLRQSETTMSGTTMAGTPAETATTTPSATPTTTTTPTTTQARTTERHEMTPAAITVGDIRTGNGFIHGIDQVLVPESVQEALAQ
ncbi:beta-Ig-H3/fasciclin [Skermanella stibiiresistens SB22]|uniref:Beta-Ig-H3/fasciclin n=1 Tax=Skermanella stibiiresistens SB22 TaxID=1385369 RepID=W9H165_9PROT|nr:fasciclin domain-containing protein [Skermanella stibiiresistens]EWY39799.1 beta-Ig-H3/fasciclin [Skermanella stibiiresistens SB22]